MLCTYPKSAWRWPVSFILIKFSDIIRSRTKFTQIQQVGCLDRTDGEMRPTTPGVQCHYYTTCYTICCLCKVITLSGVTRTKPTWIESCSNMPAQQCLLICVYTHSVALIKLSFRQWPEGRSILRHRSRFNTLMFLVLNSSSHRTSSSGFVTC